MGKQYIKPLIVIFYVNNQELLYGSTTTVPSGGDNSGIENPTAESKYAGFEFLINDIY